MQESIGERFIRISREAAITLRFRFIEMMMRQQAPADTRIVLVDGREVTCATQQAVLWAMCADLKLGRIKVCTIEVTLPDGTKGICDLRRVDLERTFFPPLQGGN